MSKESWTYFMNTPGTFFGGQSPIVYGTRSTQSLFPELTQLKAEFQATVSTPSQSFRFSAEGDGEEALIRALGCMLMLNLPPRALHEAFTNLKDMWEFYAEPEQRLLPVAPRVNRIQGRLMPAVERPELTFPDR